MFTDEIAKSRSTVKSCKLVPVVPCPLPKLYPRRKWRDSFSPRREQSACTRPRIVFRELRLFWIGFWARMRCIYKDERRVRPTRQLDRNGDAARRGAHEKGCDPRLLNASSRPAFPSRVRDDPLACGMTCNVEMENPSTGVIDDEEAVEDTEGDCWNGEEIHPGNGLPRIAQKRKPALGWFGISRCPAHRAGDRSLKSRA